MNNDHKPAVPYIPGGIPSFESRPEGNQVGPRHSIFTDANRPDPLNPRIPLGTIPGARFDHWTPPTNHFPPIPQPPPKPE